MSLINRIWEQHKKKCVLAMIVVLVITGGFLTYFFYRGESSEEIQLVDSVSSIEPEKEEDTEEISNEEEDSSPEKWIRVDLKGAVKTPGVYSVSEDSRVIDVINVAGGLAKNANTSVTNLSRKVKDEMVIIIYTNDQVQEFQKTKEQEKQSFENSQVANDTIVNDSAIQNEDLENQETDPAPSGEKQEVSSKVSINTATKEELMTLNGIGESKADAIIQYRTENGPFQKLEDLMLIKGIGESVFAKIKDDIQL